MLTLTKLALRRDTSVPIGFPAPLHLNCPCGKKVNLPFDPNAKTFKVEILTCECGAKYDSFGYVVDATYKANQEASAKELFDHWCYCDEPGDPIFCDDGVKINAHCCRKHHYHCSSCKKLIQVG